MDPFIGQIILFAGTFAPRGWAFCNGQVLEISSNTALFSIIGTIYGGDGRWTFALPDLRGRVPVHSGRNAAGPGLPAVSEGEKGGRHTNTLSVSQMPSHSHGLVGSGTTGNQRSPGEHLISPSNDGENNFVSGAAADTVMNGGSIARSGGGQPVDNMPPYLGMNYIIALVGIYPSRP